ncbi:photosystem II reaction center protein Psb28 [Cyanobacterium sp. Dongsha4]|uniref:photosystem II reaction center protein Psb28 n=1 Tax=Cyanobacterium sp. DS4 TaxID=2878255 RepID=UPI002E815833|nr:photosystem II reaction center protein Psb28 [Cyanobacterium sp. Dongsha4]WVK99213.1 photosystem II reaction center protein Psb28 [Cyanobacterium sp. Dongsha4]
MARIEFAQGVVEESIPDVRMTRSRDGSNGTATFRFESTKILDSGNTQEVTGMYLIDEEGELVTREVKCKFVNGEPTAIEAIYVIKNPEEWDRFMRFMERYAQENGLGFTKS